MQGVRHTAEIEERPTAGCCCSTHPGGVATASGQEERPAVHPQNAANKGRTFPAPSGKSDQVCLCHDQACAPPPWPTCLGVPWQHALPMLIREHHTIRPSPRVPPSTPLAPSPGHPTASPSRLSYVCIEILGLQIRAFLQSEKTCQREISSIS